MIWSIKRLRSNLKTHFILPFCAVLGESDLIYTTTLTGVGGRESYRGKEVLILGGGDGGILYELLKEDPAMVVMVEIDEEVIKACRTHMRSVCEDAMDTYEGPNKKVHFQLLKNLVQVENTKNENKIQKIENQWKIKIKNTENQ